MVGPTTGTQCTAARVSKSVSMCLSSTETSISCIFTWTSSTHWAPPGTHSTRQYLLVYHQVFINYQTSQAPSYLTDIVTQTTSVTSRTRLRSGSSLRYEQPRTRLKFGQRAFSYAAPAAWNSLPPSLQELSDTALFKRNLKTLLFQRAFYL